MADDRDTDQYPMQSGRTCSADRQDCLWDRERTEFHRSLRNIERTVSEIRERLARGDGALKPLEDVPERLVRMEETVKTLRLIVYGAAALALTGVGGAILALVIRKP